MKENRDYLVTELEPISPQVDIINHGDHIETAIPCSLLRLGYWEMFIVKLHSF